ncbi:Pentatricopeptide repeat-containing protein 2 [Paramyrothecium foliicola]|nr:Pentatricopeptide repeat-containing protein 2 [Paramyrothecium foliicola]
MTRSILNCAACVRRTVQIAHPASTVSSLRAFHSFPPAQAQAQASRTEAKSAAATVADAPRELDLSQNEPPRGSKSASERLERIVRKEMQHLTMDPFKVAQHVRGTLKLGRFDEALLLTQKVSKDMQAVVSWNALLLYLGENDKLDRAIKVYNDMKKRSQLPDVYTYTVLFKACMASSHPKRAVAEATRLYNILLRDTRLQPNTLHLNAVLNVCAKAHDLDAMFMMADSINETSRKADQWTYTIILNALCSHIRQQLKDLPFQQRKANIDKVVGQAKSLWVEVMDKWRKGEIRLDEDTVCAMGRVLLLANTRDEKRALFDILQQTMNMPNLTKSTEGNGFANKDMEDISAGGPPVPAPQAQAFYVVPTQRTLTMVLNALTTLQLTTTGIKYWNLMVRHYGVVPDSVNWSDLFTMLLVGKSSANAVASLKLVPDKHLTPGLYQKAIKTCLADNINSNVLENANEILDSMHTRLPVPDLLVLRLYVRLALSAHKNFRDQAKAGDVTSAKQAYGKQIIAALARAWDPYNKAHNHYFNGRTPTDPKAAGIRYNDQREVIAVARQMYSAFNKVISEGMLPDKDLSEIRPIGARINREIQKFYANREEREPNLRKRRGVDREEKESNDDDERMAVHYGRTFVWDTVQASNPRPARERRY